MKTYAIYMDNAFLGKEDFVNTIKLDDAKKVLMDKFWDDRLDCADASPIIRRVEHECTNVRFGFNCSCDWAAANPGKIAFHCEYCGIYWASKAQCNKCEKDIEQPEL